MRSQIKKIIGNRIVIQRIAPEDYAVVTPSQGAILNVSGPDAREPHFEAVVVAVGSRLSEPISQYDRVIIGAHPSQNRVGTRHVVWQGQSAELVSVLDVVAIVAA